MGIADSRAPTSGARLNAHRGHNNHLENILKLNEIKGFKVLSLNIRSVLPKINLLRCDFSDVSFDVFSLSESWLKPTIDNGLLGIQGYNFKRLDRTTLNLNGDIKAGGGIICYFRNIFICKYIP